MSVQPASSGRSKETGPLAGRTPVERSPRSNPADPQAPASEDRIEISDVSRGLAAAAGDVPSGTLPAERMREVAGRIATDWYKRPEVREAVIQRVLASLQG